MTGKNDQSHYHLKHRFFNRITRVSGISVLIFFLAACDSSRESAATVPPLRLVKVLEISEPVQYQYKEFPGVVDAVQKADLAFRVSGKLDTLRVKEGDIVAKDQLLAQLDDRDYRIQLNSREAEYKQVHADYLRARKLVDRGAISRSDFNKLQAQNSTAQANLATAKQTLGYTSLTAPFSGRIAKRYVENFEEISAMQPILLLQDTSSLTIKVNLPSSLMIKLHQDAQPEINAFFDTIPGQKFPLKPLEISTQADEATNTYQVTLSMEAVEGYNILPGMSVTVRGRRDIDKEREQGSFYLPAQAVLGDEQGRYVYLAIPAGEGLATVERRNVETGRLSQRGVQILSGVNAGEALIVAGMSKMYPGLEVRLSKESSL
ncbi:efflux RND transporter periplasmic adaptor subunit [Amphritea atlantica]|uniref:Efflux RND transporter periplasmic adaptor subunit n=1 Tax=Amphritea atlantica TaxID=355243 RepID=A0ABY5GXB6_9GAMM|nr:efflux RND transporter periplasmic adaptor subunit [Amphritea atlantica]